MTFSKQMKIELHLETVHCFIWSIFMLAGNYIYEQWESERLLSFRNTYSLLRMEELDTTLHKRSINPPPYQAWTRTWFTACVPSWWRTASAQNSPTASTSAASTRACPWSTTPACLLLSSGWLFVVVAEVQSVCVGVVGRRGFRRGPLFLGKIEER